MFQLCGLQEKEPERFVALIELLASTGKLEAHRLTPLLVGATNDVFAQVVAAMTFHDTMCQFCWS
jgi:hypothetical protein